MSHKQFRFSCTLKDHDADVRGLCLSMQEKDGLLSCSRDKTTKLWIPDSESHHYSSKSSFIGHKKFVSCVAAMEPIKDMYPDGLILTGSNDKTINIYLPYDEIAILFLEGHNNVISNLKCGPQGMFFSSSWDQTIRVWQLDLSCFGTAACVQVLSGHQAAVWDVALIPGKKQILSASADKTICLWENTKAICTYHGHTDCVRGLSVMSSTQFLSCSNDSTVKRWEIGGECLQTYYGHKNYVYSVDIFSDLEMFVTSGEDQTIKVWTFDNSNPVQTLPVPALSAWKVIVLLNGDLAVGCSDGSIRIFSFSENRVASEQEKLRYEEELSKLALPEEGLNLGNIDSDKLQGPESLKKPGQKDGQTLMVRNGAIVEAYQWSSVEEKWLKIGDVVGSKGSKKSTYKGKEYDYVFTVDILEGAPPLHLPYNLSEDPWFAAQKFIDDNNLSQQFLDTVANFIIDNSNQSVPMQQNSSYADPFTGQGRYQPTHNNAKPQEGYDPFTGGGRYLPDSGANGRSAGRNAGVRNDAMVNPSRYVPSADTSKANQSTHKKAITVNKYFPKTGYIFFETQNHVSMFKKLSENSKLSSKPLSSSDLEAMKLLVQSPLPIGSVDNGVKLLCNAFSWEPKLVFPALDLLRCALVCNTSFFEISFKEHTKEMLNLISNHLQPNSLNVNQLLAVRVLCNLFVSPVAISFLFDSFDGIIDLIKKLLQSNTENNNLFVAVSTLLLNFAVSFNNMAGTVKGIENMRLCMVELNATYFAQTSKLNAEALFRLLVALGTLLYGHEAAQQKAQSLKLKELVLSITSRFVDSMKIADCSTLILQML